MWAEPTIHASPPLGELRANVPWILKLASEASTTVESSKSVTRTRACIVIASGMVQA